MMVAFPLPTTLTTVDHAPTAAEMTQVMALLNSLASPLTDYSGSLVISASPTPPTKGNSTYAAYYVQLGQFVIYTGKITIGSTFVAGSGNYSLNLPITASAAALASLMTGVAMVNDSGTSIRGGTVQLSTTTAIQMYSDAVIGAPLGNAGPGTAWAANDWFAWNLIYEAA